MEFKFLHILAFLSVAIVASHATLPSEEYWNSVLPNTPMPKTVKHLLLSGSSVGKDGVIVETHPDSLPYFRNDETATKTQLNDLLQSALLIGSNVGKDGVIAETHPDSLPYFRNDEAATKTQLNDILQYALLIGSSVGKDGVIAATHPDSLPYFRNDEAATKTQLNDLLQSALLIGSSVGKDGVIVETHPDSLPYFRNDEAATKTQLNDLLQSALLIGSNVGKDAVIAGTHPNSLPYFRNDEAATKTQLKDLLQPGSNVGKGSMIAGTHKAATKTHLNGFFYLEKDLQRGKRINWQFSKPTNQATFLPQQVADSIPFSSNKLPEIFDKFSVSPTSDQARVMKKTIKICEENANKSEETLCATSLESMVDYTISQLGKDVRAISTIMENGARKEYRIVGVKKAAAAVVCHSLEYVYAVFYCHKTTDAYKVEMVGAGGSKVEAVAVCHKETSEWSPKHLALQMLNVKPGTPICHFLPEGNIVWVPRITNRLSFVV